jgi:hypothetical protein
VEILAAARAVVAADGYTDLDVIAETGERDLEVRRHGQLPCTGTFTSVQGHD